MTCQTILTFLKKNEGHNITLYLYYRDNPTVKVEFTGSLVTYSVTTGINTGFSCHFFEIVLERAKEMDRESIVCFYNDELRYLDHRHTKGT